MADKPEARPEKPKKPGVFPKISLLYGLGIIVLVLLDFLNIYSLSNTWLVGLLFLTGIWLFFQSMSIGFARKRNEILKKFI